MQLFGALENLNVVAIAEDYPRMAELVCLKKERRYEVELDRIEEARASRLVKQDDIAGFQTLPDLIERKRREPLVAKPPSVYPAWRAI